MASKEWSVQSKKLPRTVGEFEEILLQNRNIVSDTQISEFFNPKPVKELKLKDFGLSRTQVAKGIDRILKAKEKGEKVVIYGDYDVDGVCATTIMWQTLNSMAVSAFPFVPDRFEDGYGLSKSGVEKILSKHPDISLLILVDNGIVAHEVIHEVAAKGIEVIVIDHHEINGDSPAQVVVHSTVCCATALVWAFCRELREAAPESVPNGQFVEQLELVALATMADQIPLISVNRSLVTEGISILRRTKRVGLRELMKMAGIESTSIGSYEILFMLAPRINASGRMGEAINAVRLLCTKDGKKANQIALEIEKQNVARQAEMKKILDSSFGAQIDETFVLLVGDFHEGVIGLAAARLAEQHMKPAFVVTTRNGKVKGSARSIKGVHLTNSLNSKRDIFISFGGHEMAAGFSLDASRLEDFRNALVELIHIPSEMELPYSAECELPESLISQELLNTLNRFEPFGRSNPEPLLLSKNLKIENIQLMGKNKEHAKAKVAGSADDCEVVFFRIGGNGDVLMSSRKIDLVYSIGQNTWGGKNTLQLISKKFNAKNSSETIPGPA